MTSDTVLNVDEVRKGEVSEVVIFIDRMVGAKKYVLQRRIRDCPTRSPRVTLGGRVEVDGRLG